MNYKTGIKRIIILPLLIIALTGCNENNIVNKRPMPSADEYEKKDHQKVMVSTGDLCPTFELDAKMEGYSVTTYCGLEETMEIDEILVEEGSEVKKGDVLIKFKEEDEQTEERYRELEDRLKEDELLISHLENEALIDPKSDYYTDYKMILNDIELINVQLEEIDRRRDKLTYVATDDGTIAFIAKELYNGYAKKSDTLMKSIKGSEYYTATTEEDYDFKIGDKYDGQSGSAKALLEIVDIKKDGKVTTVSFMPAEGERIISDIAEYKITLSKEAMKNVLYVDSAAVMDNDGKAFVYIVDDEGYIRAKEIAVRCVVDDKSIIESGLEGGEWVAID